MFRVSRPMEEVVLNCWETETKETPCLSNRSMIWVKSPRERRSGAGLNRPQGFRLPRPSAPRQRALLRIEKFASLILVTS